MKRDSHGSATVSVRRALYLFCTGILSAIGLLGLGEGILLLLAIEAHLRRLVELDSAP